MKLSIIIPVYNERGTLAQCIARVEAVVMPWGFEKEIIVVDDGSTDAPTEVFDSLKERHVVLRHDKNKGKGTAIRTAIPHVTGEYVVTQDADLELDPQDLAHMLERMLADNLTVLYGSRRLGRGTTEGVNFVFYSGGVVLSLLTNILFGQSITDEPTCYKMFRSEFLKSLPLRCERFEYCPEVTALTALRGVRIQEVPISYHPRTIQQGKKVRFHDGAAAVFTLLKYRVFPK
jgi:glycosyltransferase involved in cell wall biosynthesis